MATSVQATTAAREHPDLIEIATTGPWVIFEVDDSELAGLAEGWQPTVVHVDTANRQISEELAKRLAGERRYVEVDATAN